MPLAECWVPLEPRTLESLRMCTEVLTGQRLSYSRSHQAQAASNTPAVYTEGTLLRLPTCLCSLSPPPVCLLFPSALSSAPTHEQGPVCAPPALSFCSCGPHLVQCPFPAVPPPDPPFHTWGGEARGQGAGHVLHLHVLGAHCFRQQALNKHEGDTCTQKAGLGPVSPTGKRRLRKLPAVTKVF